MKVILTYLRPLGRIYLKIIESQGWLAMKKSLFVLSIILLTISQLCLAKGTKVTTTYVELSIQNNYDLEPNTSSLLLVDNKPANLMLYDKSNNPKSRIEVISFKEEKSPDTVITLSIKQFDFSNEGWSLVNKASITNLENQQGQLTIGSNEKEWVLLATANNGPSYSINDPRITKLEECDQNTILGKFTQSNFDSPEKNPDGCCTAQCQDGTTGL